MAPVGHHSLSSSPTSPCRVAQHKQANSMDESNLGRCFGPTVLRFEGKTQDMMGDLSVQALAGEFFSMEADAIWSLPTHLPPTPSSRTHDHPL